MTEIGHKNDGVARATGQAAGPDSVWVFIGLNARYPAGVLRKFPEAEGWIMRNGLTGIPSLYPPDQGVPEWAIRSGWFRPRQRPEISADSISRCTSVYQAHHQYEQGQRVS